MGNKENQENKRLVLSYLKTGIEGLLQVGTFIQKDQTLLALKALEDSGRYIQIVANSIRARMQETLNYEEEEKEDVLQRDKDRELIKKNESSPRGITSSLLSTLPIKKN